MRPNDEKIAEVKEESSGAGNPNPPEQKAPEETGRPNGALRQNVGEFGWKFDNDEDPNMFTLEIPIGAVAADPSINGITFLLGFFENAKNEAVAQVRRKRQKLMQRGAGRIIVPGQESFKVH